MRPVKTVLFVLLAFAFHNCGSMFDIAGKGAKTECCYLHTDSLKIVCSCNERKITSASVYENTSAKQSFGKLIFQKKWDQPANEFVLPLERDSLANKFIQVELHFTNPEPREAYYIDWQPGDLKNKTIIYARCFNH